nr:hypothetical protein BgiMline_016503 [Biomphalaria glabrata]
MNKRVKYEQYACKDCSFMSRIRHQKCAPPQDIRLEFHDKKHIVPREEPNGPRTQETNRRPPLHTVVTQSTVAGGHYSNQGNNCSSHEPDPPWYYKVIASFASLRCQTLKVKSLKVKYNHEKESFV